MSGCWSHSAEHAGAITRMERECDQPLTEPMREYLRALPTAVLLTEVCAEMMGLFAIDAPTVGLALGQWVKERARR